MSSLRSRTITGVMWSLGERMGLNLLKLGISIVLARLLSPAEFGLVGMLAIFVAIAQSLFDSGFGGALVQKQDTDYTDECSVFYYNVGVGIVVAAALWLGAPTIARFFQEPQLTALARFFAVGVLIESSGLIHTTLLTKRIEFGTQMRVRLFATMTAGLVAIVLAYSRYGVWSLAVQLVAEAALRTLVLWLVCTWRPSWQFSLASLKRLFGFGSRLLAAGLLSTLYQNLHQAFIGKVFTASDLGYYGRARSMELAAAGATSHTISRVMFPALATIKDDPARLRHAYRRTMTLASFVHLPMMALLIATARPLLIFLLSERWAPSVPYFQLLCLAGLLYPLQMLNLGLLKVAGRSDLLLRLEVAKKLLMVVSIAVTYRWGIVGLLYGQIATALLAYVLDSTFAGRLVSYHTVQQLRDVTPFVLIATLVGGVTYLAGQAFRVRPLPQLILQTGVALTCYLGISYALHLPELSELVSVARHFVDRPAV